MTYDQANSEAERRWGNGSVVMVPLIGCVVLKGKETMGIGRTWDLAFADADSRNGGVLALSEREREAV